MSPGRRARATVANGAQAAGILATFLWLGACASASWSPREESPVGKVEPTPLVGVITPAEILASNPDWADELVRSEPDPRAAERLSVPATGREVVIFLGTWCSDSRSGLARLWRAVEMAGGDFGFPVRYVGVDRTKTEPADLLEGVDLRYVPTLIVFEGETEVGRIIETAPNSIESDLADLIQGEATGWLSGRDDLGAERAPERQR